MGRTWSSPWPIPTGPAPDPGQFYMLTAAERWGGGEDERPFLPRAFSVMRAREGELDFLLEDVGPGTNRLCELGRGDESALLGPLGKGFTRPREGRRPILVGGGVGIAPLAIWGDTLGASALTLLGFRDAAHAEGAALIPGARVITDDRGFVTALLTAELGCDPRAEVYACGPPPMLDAVAAICKDRGRARPARHGVGHGLRLRRLLRLRRPHPARLRPPLRRRPGDRIDEL